MTIYCTYLTVYSGNKLPPFYIGSTTIKKIESGYHGSVSSREYKKLWKQELKENPLLFNTKILTRHADRNETYNKEEYFQKQLKVIQNPLYINMCYANNHFDTTSKIPWNFGISRSEETKIKISNTLMGKSNGPRSEETKIKISNGLKGKPKSEEHKAKISDKLTGIERTIEFKQKLTISQLGKIFSDEHKAKISKSNKGKPKSEEHKANISKGLIGKKLYIHTDTGQKRYFIPGEEQIGFYRTKSD